MMKTSIVIAVGLAATLGAGTAVAVTAPSITRLQKSSWVNTDPPSGTDSYQVRLVKVNGVCFLESRNSRWEQESFTYAPGAC